MSVHACPRFCHRCPDMGGGIMPECTGSAVYPSDNFDHCSCKTQCASCESWETEGRCRWPVELFIQARVHDLRHGDTVANPPRGKIVDIQPAEGSPAFLDFKVRIGTKPRKGLELHTYAYRWAVKGMVKKLTSVQCGEPGCYRHIRELDEGAYICASHWNAQLEVA